MRLHFKTSGQGRPVVILHGLFGSSDNWLGVAPKLSESFQLFILDLRNHGQSPHSAEMSYPFMAGDVAEFLAAQQLPAAVVMGHSLGGKVAMQLALTQPERVEKLIVADMAPRVYQPSHARLIAALQSLDLTTFQTRQQIEEVLAEEIPSLAVRRFLLKNLGRAEAGGLVWKMNLPAIAENYPALGEAIAAPVPFAKPSLFLRGGKSNFIRAEDEPMIRALFPQAEIQTIAGAAHWVHADKPEEFAGRVRAFLEAD